MTSTFVKENDLESIGEFLEGNIILVERWLKNHASSELRQHVYGTLQTSFRKSNTFSDLSQPSLPVSHPRTKKENEYILSNDDLELERFMELVRDVANELDIDVLCHKILKNVSILTHADRGSLFLARGVGNDRYLVAKLFDVRHDTTLEEAVQIARSEEIRIPFGIGIAGSVAQSKSLINIKDAYNDNRFNSEIDMRTGYKTNSILCMPICNSEGDVIGVAQIINKTNDYPEFTKTDIELFQRYLTFCGIGLQNAQLFEVSVLEYKRNQYIDRSAERLVHHDVGFSQNEKQTPSSARALESNGSDNIYDIMDSELVDAMAEILDRRDVLTKSIMPN